MKYFPKKLLGHKIFVYSLLGFEFFFEKLMKLSRPSSCIINVPFLCS